MRVSCLLQESSEGVMAKEGGQELTVYDRKGVIYK